MDFRSNLLCRKSLVGGLVSLVVWCGWLGGGSRLLLHGLEGVVLCFLKMFYALRLGVKHFRPLSIVFS